MSSRSLSKVQIDYLRKKREELGITSNAELAEEICKKIQCSDTEKKKGKPSGITEMTVQRVFSLESERGDCKFRPATISLICLGLEVDEKIFWSLLPQCSDDDAIIKPVQNQSESESTTDSHLVIATFFDGILSDKEDIYRVNCKIYYPDPRIDPVSLGSETVTIDKLSSTIRKKIREAHNELAMEFESSENSWSKPIIRLFIPLDLMGKPIGTWLDSQLHEYCLIIGCSDRYDTANENFGEWMNKHREGWEKLKKKEHPSTLKQLEWTDTMPSNSNDLDILASDLAKYSGFRCRGNYLKPGENYLEYWRILVASGIPLALWGCESIVSPNTTATIFDRLTDYDRFGFLQQIPRLREECCRSGHDYFGVFHEHPRYRPSIERALQQPGQT